MDAPLGRRFRSSDGGVPNLLEWLLIGESLRAVFAQTPPSFSSDCFSTKSLPPVSWPMHKVQWTAAGHGNAEGPLVK